MKDEPKFKLVYVKWTDAMADDNTWKTNEDAIDWADNVRCEVDEIGYLLHEDEDALGNKYILLASKANGDLVAGLMRIPKAYIIKITSLSKKVNQKLNNLRGEKV